MINYIKKFLFSFTKEGMEIQRKQMGQQNCQHKKWTCDTQIRTIECNECGLRAWIQDYKSLYN